MRASENYPKLQQSKDALQQAAKLADVTTQKTTRVPLLTVQGGIAISSAPPKAPAPSGAKDLWLTFFFDGTGNNLDADQGTDEHSNVARLYRAHQENDEGKGVFRFYIPGIGTRFAEIGDPGGEMSGNGFGARGEDRLQWAMDSLEQRIKASGGKGGTINVALFGFSRGATLARAFAVRIAKLSEKKSGIWHFMPARQPIRLYFLGLFDTVASVGLAISANNKGAIGQVSSAAAMGLRYSESTGTLSNSPWAIATGFTPGADPAKGLFDGHGSWADELRIPEMVEECFHLAAGHETRNSFPLDSVLQGNFYPKNCWEMVLPGVHSDVGGGYRPGEGARSLKPGSMLSLIALRLMRDTALHARVPLLQTIPDKKRLKDFGMDEGSAGEYKKLLERFNHYMNAVKGGAGEPLGRQVLAHMRLYYQWRFYKVAANMKARKAGLPTQDEAILREYEPIWAAQKVATQSEMDRLDAESQRLHDAYDRAVWSMIRQSRPEYEGGPTREQLGEVRNLMDTSKQKRNEYLAVKAVQDTLPKSDGSLAKNLRLYDEQLMTDALMLKLMSFTGKLRPHYRALLDAYEAEFKHNKGLRDEKIIAFFDEYVHDSLASFAGDATLPSDPRVIFIGGNRRLQYAVTQPQRPSISELA